MHLASRLVQNDHTDRTRRPFYPLDKRYRAGGVPRIGVDFLNDRPRSAEADFFWALSSRTPWKARPRRLKMAGQDGLRTAPAPVGLDATCTPATTASPAIGHRSSTKFYPENSRRACGALRRFAGPARRLNRPYGFALRSRTGSDTRAQFPRPLTILARTFRLWYNGPTHSGRVDHSRARGRFQRRTRRGRRQEVAR